MELNLSSFEKAISSLEAIIKRYQNEKEDDAVRDSMIKRFEYCYETSHKILRRFLESVLPSKENW
ncbi:MAG: nucleotidyltransferase substrate binding protein, partial [Holosporales bacterium]|nr:nucleotidyltransferase substrate binding protein [Holosporales bacterium]